MRFRYCPAEHDWVPAGYCIEMCCDMCAGVAAEWVEIDEEEASWATE